MNPHTRMNRYSLSHLRKIVVTAIFFRQGKCQAQFNHLLTPGMHKERENGDLPGAWGVQQDVFVFIAGGRVSKELEAGRGEFKTYSDH